MSQPDWIPQSYTVNTKPDGSGVTVKRDINAYDVGRAIGTGIGLLSALNASAADSIARGQQVTFESYMHQGKFDAAYESASEMAQSSNDGIRLAGRINQAIALRSLGKPQDGADIMSASLAKFDKMSGSDIPAILARIYYERGLCYQCAGNDGDAIRDYTQSIRLNPQQDDTAIDYCQRGLALRDVGNHEQAVADLSLAIKLAPGVARYYTERAIIYERLGQTSLAIRDYQTAIRLDPKSIVTYELNASLLFSQGDSAAAAAAITQAISAAPTNSDLYRLRANYYHNAGQIELALADERKIDELRREAEQIAQQKEETERKRQEVRREHLVTSMQIQLKKDIGRTYLFLALAAIPLCLSFLALLFLATYVRIIGSILILTAIWAFVMLWFAFVRYSFVYRDLAQCGAEGVPLVGGQNVKIVKWMVIGAMYRMWLKFEGGRSSW